MAKPSLFSLVTVAVVLFISLVAYRYPLPKLKLQTYYSAESPVNLGAKATFNDVLNLLGTSKQQATVDRQVAQQLRSCFKYLVPPLSSTDAQVNFSSPIEMVTRRSTEGVANDDDDKIWFAPEEVQELVRLVIDFGGDPQAIMSTLDPTPIPVPDIEGAKEAKCGLTRFDKCKRFGKQELNGYQNFLFDLIKKRSPNIGLNVVFNRFDLFHGHLFITKDARIGILYHAKEYPKESPQFPYDQGNCQTGSSLAYDASQMNLRNILWLAPYITKEDWAPGTLLALDARPNGIVYRDLIENRPQDRAARTILDGGFGDVVVDTNYLNVGWPGPSNYQLFIC